MWSLPLLKMTMVSETCSLRNDCVRGASLLPTSVNFVVNVFQVMKNPNSDLYLWKLSAKGDRDDLEWRSTMK